VSGGRAFAAFWWNFIVGDDWRTAAGITVALALTTLLTHTGISAWWLIPLAVTLLLAASLRRACRPSSRRSTSAHAAEAASTARKPLRAVEDDAPRS
jgi:hypothetical protein